LRRLNSLGRLLWYNLGTAAQRNGESPVIPVRFFSAEAALNLLAEVGVLCVRSLGIDGGASYSQDFADLRDKTLLANTHTSFDRQFGEIARTILRTGIDYAPLDVESPIRVYVAATESEMLPVKLLEYSIRKHTSMSVDVLPLHRLGIGIPLPQNPANHPRTPFSFQRFLIPEAAGYHGRAIYFDSDMQVFKDLRYLWTLPFNGADMLTVGEPPETGRRPQFSVMVLNCSSLKWNVHQIIEDLDKERLTYEQLMYEMTVARNVGRTIDPSWNCLERYRDGETALLHFTDMDTQPWVSCDNPLGYLWVRDLIEAIDTGHISKDDVMCHVEKGHVRPSLLYQIEHRIEDSFLLPRSARSPDNDFSAPYRTIRYHGATPWLSGSKSLKAVAQKYYQRSPLYRLQRKFLSYLSR
jgi:hypothetical protein